MIRFATTEDIPRCVEMGQRFHAETDYKNQVTIEPDALHKLGEQLVAKNGLLVSERGGQLVGMIGFVLFPHFFSGEMVAGEVFWWVDPEHRGEGPKLMKEAERHAREAGAKRMQMIAPNERVGTLYERCGYSFVETAYQKAL